MIDKIRSTNTAFNMCRGWGTLSSLIITKLDNERVPTNHIFFLVLIQVTFTCTLILLKEWVLIRQYLDQEFSEEKKIKIEKVDDSMVSNG